MHSIDVQKLKSDFPIFQHHPELVYLDGAATSQKPKQVISAVKNFYEQHNANIHRGLYDLSQSATELFENTRNQTADFIGAKDPAEIIFTGNATEAINFVGFGWAKKTLQPGDIIVTTEMEHHANIVPWLRLKEEKGIQIHFLPVDLQNGENNFRLEYQSLIKKNIDPKKIKLVALTHASNVLGTINPVRQIVNFLRANEIQAKILVDAAQSIPHLPVDVQELQCDFLAFSSHKMFGPSGVGILWGKRELLEQMDPFFVGSHMIKKVSKGQATWADIPAKFEAGTKNIEGVVGLGAAIRYIKKIGYDKIANHELQLTKRTLTMFKTHPELQLFGPNNANGRLGVFSFTISGVHAHDISEILNRKYIAVRSGHHCAQVLMQAINQTATIRASLSAYNTIEDIKMLSNGIEEVLRIFKNT